MVLEMPIKQILLALIFICCLLLWGCFTFSSSSESPGQFQPNLAKSILGLRGFKFVQMRTHPFPSGDNYIIAKIYDNIWGNLEIFFPRTAWPIATKHGKKHPWVMGILVCSNEGSRPFPKGDNYETVKMHWWNSKFFFSRTARPIETKFAIPFYLLGILQECLICKMCWLPF